MLSTPGPNSCQCHGTAMASQGGSHSGHALRRGKTSRSLRYPSALQHKRPSIQVGSNTRSFAPGVGYPFSATCTTTDCGTSYEPQPATLPEEPARMTNHRAFIRRLTVKLRDRAQAPEQSRGRTVITRARVGTTDLHGPLQRLLEGTTLNAWSSTRASGDGVLRRLLR